MLVTIFILGQLAFALTPSSGIPLPAGSIQTSEIKGEYKRLLNCNGVQQMLVHDGTGETSCEVLWDEKIHGPIPANLPCEVGACKRVGNSLQEDPALKVILDEQKAAKAAKDKAEGDAKVSLLAIKAKLDADQSLTAAEQRKLLKALAEKILGNN